MNYKILLYTFLLFIICFCMTQAQNTIIFSDDFNRANNPNVGNGWNENNPSQTQIENQTCLMKSINLGDSVAAIYRMLQVDYNKIYSFSFLVKSNNSNSNYVFISFGSYLTDPVRLHLDAGYLYLSFALSYDPPRASHEIRLFQNGVQTDTIALNDSYTPQANVYCKINGTISNSSLEITVDYLNDGSMMEHFSIPIQTSTAYGDYFIIGNYDGIGSDLVSYNFDDLLIGESDTQQFEVDQNTIALWHFNEGSGNIFYDETSYANDGDIIDGTWTTEGYFAGAIDFDGIDDYLTIPMSSSLTSLTNQATIEMYFKYTGPVNSSYSLWRYGTTVNNVTSSAKIGTGTKKLYAMYYSNGQGLGGIQLESINPLVENQWYHVALCYDGSKERLFINGELQDEVASTEILDTPDDRFWFGRNGYATNPKYFEGIIDEIRISNIARYSTTGVEENENGFPTDFRLSQNYPNPFNPSTKIKYSVPGMGFVTIKVFDVLGNEISTLVNEEKPAGTYEVEWNAVNLSSGVYFYQLQAGSFIETKKMILLR